MAKNKPESTPTSAPASPPVAAPPGPAPKTEKPKPYGVTVMPKKPKPTTD